MPAKPKKPSPAHARTAASPLSTPSKVPNESQWPAWENKVDKIASRSVGEILRGWHAHVPEINPPGGPPRESISGISAIHDILPSVPKMGDLVKPMVGARNVVLHEGYYLAHKAVHVEISCANYIKRGFHTWAVVDAYQGSLFALASIMCFLGITVERESNDFILIDVWGASLKKPAHKSSPIKDAEEIYHFIRFKTLDHFHKWAILKRILRTLDSDMQLVTFLNSAIEGRGEKEFARHRNHVHYDSKGWIADDLLQECAQGPIKQAQTSQEAFEQIVDGSPSGTVYLMCALVELACQFAQQLANTRVLENELQLLNRRLVSVGVLTKFNWADMTST